MTEADRLAMRLEPRAEDCQLLPEARRGKEGIPPPGSRGSTALRHLDFGFQPLELCETINSCCFQPPGSWNFITAAPGS